MRDFNVWIFWALEGCSATPEQRTQMRVLAQLHHNTNSKDCYDEGWMKHPANFFKSGVPSVEVGDAPWLGLVWWGLVLRLLIIKKIRLDTTVEVSRIGYLTC